MPEPAQASDRPGSFLGGVLLVAGSCIGAGMLGLPILTGIAGFFPALVVFLCTWAYMITTGFLLVEVKGWLPQRQVNLLSMTEHSLGRAGRSVCWTLYLFLFYALLVAYISGSGNLISTLLYATAGLHIPLWAGSLFFATLFGGVVYLGMRQVDLWNRWLMVGMILFFLALLLLVAPRISPHMLLRAEGKYAIFSLPILVTSFGFHNMVPSLATYMKGDLKRVRRVILTGSLATLVIYLIWEILVLGTVPLSGIQESLRHDEEAAQALAVTVKIPWIPLLAEGLAFFAILTSFLEQALSLTHFLADGFKMPHTAREPLALVAAVLLPPLIFSLIYPDLFFKALNFAGGICAVTLFGVMPVLMVWIGRYRKAASGPYLVPGGRLLLSQVLAFSLLIFFIQISMMFGAFTLPK